jgi:hypothetical protein
MKCYSHESLLSYISVIFEILAISLICSLINCTLHANVANIVLICRSASATAITMWHCIHSLRHAEHPRDGLLHAASRHSSTSSSPKSMRGITIYIYIYIYIYIHSRQRDSDRKQQVAVVDDEIVFRLQVCRIDNHCVACFFRTRRKAANVQRLLC